LVADEFDLYGKRINASGSNETRETIKKQKWTCMAKGKLSNGRVRQTTADFDPPASPTALNMRLLIPYEISVVGSPAGGGFSLIEDPPSFWRTRGAKIPPTADVVRDFPFLWNITFIYSVYTLSGFFVIIALLSYPNPHTIGRRNKIIRLIYQSIP
jgi:hypothetical protein